MSLCELCPLESGKVFDDTSHLRAHLIENHATFVAEALLSPNIQNKIHVWLLANVDYSVNAKIEEIGFDNESDGEDMDNNDPFDVKEEEEQQPQQTEGGQQQQLGLDGNEDNEDNNNNGISGDSIEMLLKGILGDQIGAETEPCSSGIGQLQQADIMPTSADAETDQTLTIFGTALKSLLFPSANSPLSDDSSVLSCRASTVDSKAMRKAHCRVCNLDICSTARQRHVYMVHLKKKDLFKCPHCDYTNSNSVWEVQKHSRVQHGRDAKPISQEERHKSEIQMWSQLCFPEWKQKRRIDGDGGEEYPKRRKEETANGGGETNNLLVGLDEVIGELFGGGMQNNRKGDDAEDIDRREKDKEEEWKEEDPPQRAMAEESAGSGSDRLCHLCMEESKYPGRHIAQRHLKKPLYECPVCLKFGSYESCTVNKHIHKVHPKEAKQAVPISNLDKYSEEIRELQSRCFPNRQMKLVRPVSISGKTARPRERHQCGLCGADVAQSDRQRHVFHKHLCKGKIFECPLCEFSSNYDIHRVKWHIKWDHKECVDGSGSQFEPISHEALYRDEIDLLNEQCFPGWQRKRQQNSEEFGRTSGDTMTPKPNLDFEEIEQKLNDFQNAMMASDDGKEEDNEEEEGEDTERKEEKKSTLDGLVEKAMRTVDMAMKYQKEEEGKTAIKETEVDGGTANAIEWTCQLCQEELKPGTNLLRHVAKDHLNLPLYQCPVCENHGAHSAYEVRSHMLRSHSDTTQEPLSNLEEHLDEIEGVYRRCFPCKEFKAGGERSGTENVRHLLMNEARVRCKECGQEMKTEDRQIHVYRHHLREPRLYECPACDFSHYACSSDVRNHILRAHKDQPKLVPRANLLRYSKEIAEWNEHCFPGWINRRLPVSVMEDFNSCRLCGMEDVRQTSRHIAENHLHIPLHQCPLCEYGAAEARLVQRHMRNNHTTKECEGLEPIANVEKHRIEFSELHNQCFPGRPKRLSNITIADESRRAKCRGCGQTISKKRRLLHLLERHLKKPMYKCKYCLFTSTHERSTVEEHQKEKHANKPSQILSTIGRHKTELKLLATECFNEPELRLELLV